MLKRWSANVVPFHGDEQNSTLLIFLCMILALVLATGAALDFARVSNMRAGVDTGVKLAARAGANALQDVSLKDNQIEAIVLSQFDKGVALARHVGTIDPPTIFVDRSAASVTVETKGTVWMTTSRLFGVNEISVPMTFTTRWAPRSADAH